MLAKLARLTVCDCGFPTLDERIPLGTEYEIDPDKRKQATMFCGGCGKPIELVVVYAAPRLFGQTGGFLPECLFDNLPRRASAEAQPD